LEKHKNSSERVPVNNRQLGKKGEEFAAEYLKRKNYRILCRNYRAGRLGEIDLIAADNKRIIFAEVKARTGNSYGAPAEAVSYRKQQTMRKVASCFLRDYDIADSEIRFDVIEIIMTRNCELVDINHIEGAF